MPENQPLKDRSRSLADVALLFLRLGATAFGGPAAHVSIMHDEIVKRRRWLTDQQFLDLVGATNLIPGPNSTELAMHIGYLRAGWRGLLVGGACFIAPAMLIVLLLAWVYVRFGSTPQAEWLLYGVKPVVIAVIVQALWKLGQKAVNGVTTTLVGVLVIVGYFSGFNEVALMCLGGLMVMAVDNLKRLSNTTAFATILPFSGPLAAAAGVVPFSLTGFLLNLLKIGAIWYGSGYVLVAFLRVDFVDRLGWISDQQLLDAVAIGQITPGPLLTTVTFIGYLLHGTTGALLATLAICIPSFFFVAVSNPLIPRLRRSRLLAGVLDGVNVAALGLMAAVTWQLGRASILDPLTIGIAVISAVFLLRFSVNSVWLIAGGAAAGLMRAWLN